MSKYGCPSCGSDRVTVHGTFHGSASATITGPGQELEIDEDYGGVPDDFSYNVLANYNSLECADCGEEFDGAVCIHAEDPGPSLRVKVLADLVVCVPLETGKGFWNDQAVNSQRG